MFKKTNTTDNDAPTGMATILAAGTEIKGNIQSKGDIRVDGILTGNLHTTSKVVVGPSGSVVGDVEAQQAEVLGKVTGNIRISDMLSLKGNCEVNGNIYTGQLQVDASASFNGECHMGHNTNVVAFNQELPNAATATS